MRHHLTAISVRRWHHSTQRGGVGVLSAAPIDEMKQVNFSGMKAEWKTNVTEGDRERLCLISAANVSDGSYLAHVLRDCLLS